MANDTTMTIVGNLTRDPELSFTPSGAAWVRFAIASTPRRFDQATGQWTDADTLFLNCTAWRELAEHIADSLTKGTRVVATGRLRQRSWETDDGQKRTTVELDLDDIGPSLRRATAKVTKATRHSDQAPPPEDPWAAAPASTTANGHASTAATAGAGSYEEPPF